MIYAKYKLLKDLPDLKAGVIFEHREYDKKYPDRGNIGSGALVLGWLNGSCQGNWCGETYIFPGQLANNKEWFEKIEDNGRAKLINERDKLLKQLEEIENAIENYESNKKIL